VKQLFCSFLGVLASAILSACTAPPIPTTEIPVTATATNTLIVASPSQTATPSLTSTSSPMASSSPTLTASPTLTPTPIVTPIPDGLPDMPDKPVPQSSTFQGCPPVGDGGDSKLNMLKNRIDEGNYVPVTFDAIFNLTWPKTTEQRPMNTWSAEDAAAIAKYEGIPVVVEGFLVRAKKSGSESANCHGTAADMTDWHVWFTKTAGEDRTHSIVIETTPRIRALHKWNFATVGQIAVNQIPVRISGWLFFDPDHPDQINLTRGTIWEIHPVMQIEVLQNSQWVLLDDFVP